MPGTMLTELILNNLKLLTKEILDKGELSDHGIENADNNSKPLPKQYSIL